MQALSWALSVELRKETWPDPGYGAEIPEETTVYIANYFKSTLGCQWLAEGEGVLISRHAYYEDMYT